MLKIDKETAKLIAKLFLNKLGHCGLIVVIIGLVTIGLFVISIAAESLIPDINPWWITALVWFAAAVWTAIDIVRAVRKRRKRHEG